MYIAMQDDAQAADHFPATVLALGAEREDIVSVWRTWLKEYDANECLCFKQEDKDRESNEARN